MRAYQNKRKGQVLIFIVMGIGLMIALAGLAVDLVYVYTVKVRLVSAVDAAALGAARALGRGETSSQQQTEVTRISTLLFDANFPSGFMLTGNTGQLKSPGVQVYANSVPSGSWMIADPTNVEAGVREVRLGGEADVPLFFMRMFNRSTLPIAANAIAARRDVALALVLDRSGSLNRADGFNPGPTAFDDVREAARTFVDQFDNLTDNVALVSFGSGSHLDFALNTNFKSAIDGLLDDMISDNSGTNAPLGLWQAYQELKINADPTALHIVVFFTDGVPTHFPGNFQTNTNPPGSSCDNKTKSGVIGTPTSPGATLALGLTVVDPGAPPVPADQYDWISGCGFSTTDVRNSVPFLPTVDLYGTSIMGGQSIPLWTAGKPQTDGTNIRPIAVNLTVNTADRMRQDATMPLTVYGIGLGGEAGGYPADHTMMRNVTNDASQTSTYSDLEPEGLYVYAPSPLQLQQAFQTVANEIFRLIQ